MIPKLPKVKCLKKITFRPISISWLVETLFLKCYLLCTSRRFSQLIIMIKHLQIILKDTYNFK